VFEISLAKKDRQALYSSRAISPGSERDVAMSTPVVLRRDGGIVCFGLLSVFAFFASLTLPCTVPAVFAAPGNREAVDSTNGVTFRTVVKDGVTTVTRTGKDKKTIKVDPARLPAKEALLVAILLNDPARAKALLERDPSLTQSKDTAGMTPLHHAAFHGDTAIVKMLLARGAAVNVRNAAGTTPLELASDDATKAVLKKHGAKS
jgi:hypothetical protein